MCGFGNYFFAPHVFDTNHSSLSLHTCTHTHTHMYLHSLAHTLTQQCEDLEDLPSLHQLHVVVKGMILLGDTTLLESLLMGDNFADVVGALEYEPGMYMVVCFCLCGGVCGCEAGNVCGWRGNV